VGIFEQSSFVKQCDNYEGLVSVIA